MQSMHADKEVLDLYLINVNLFIFVKIKSFNL